MAAIFISYRHVDPDQKLAAELAAYLAQNKISCFVDSDIRISQEWSGVIDSEIRACIDFQLIDEGRLRDDGRVATKLRC